MTRNYLDQLLKLSQKERSAHFRAASLLFGAILFLVIVPFILITLAEEILIKAIIITWPRSMEVIVGLTSTALGLVFLIWSVFSQWFVGKGTPAPVAPTQKLVIVGPYRLCRNPIQLGAMLYYLGIGSYFSSLTFGLFAFLIVLVIASFYHKFVEEKELMLRFGAEYKEYREKTPFLIPRLPR